MNRTSFLSAVPRIALAAACVFVAARVSNSRRPDSPPCGAVDGVGEVHATEVAPYSPYWPSTQEPAATSRWVQPLPLPAEDDQSWLQEWLDLIARNGKTGSGC